jgi:hypothetical protein
MRTVTGLFADRQAVEDALNSLAAAGFSHDEIGLAVREDEAAALDEEDKGEAAVATAVRGVAGGGALGGLIGLLAGAGALLVPGVGPVLAAGALASVAGATAAGAGIGAAYGGLVGALTGWGVAEEHAHAALDVLHAGGALLVVRPGNAARAQLAADILGAAGAAVQLHD